MRFAGGGTRFTVAYFPEGRHIRQSFSNMDAAIGEARAAATKSQTLLRETGPLPENGVMHRDGIRGHCFEKKFTFAPERLSVGRNVFQLRPAAQVWHQAVLYDYLRLEAKDERKPF